MNIESAQARSVAQLVLQHYENPAVLTDILWCEVGSTAHGVSVPSLGDDLDLLGVYVESPDYVLGLKVAETEVLRTAEKREGKVGVRSGPGDVDLVLHPLQKFMRLASKGNPTVLMLLFAPQHLESKYGNIIRDNYRYFWSKHGVRAFAGYMESQLKEIAEGKTRDVKRPELIEKYGFDTKFAMHALRLGYQGLEYANHGRFQIPMDPPLADYLVSVRQGKVTKADVVYECDDLYQVLQDLATSEGIPDDPDMDGINQLLCDIYSESWSYYGFGLPRPTLRDQSLVGE